METAIRQQDCSCACSADTYLQIAKVSTRMQGNIADPANWPVEDDPKEEIVSMAASRVVMHQIVLPAEVDSLGICFGGQVRRTSQERYAPFILSMLISFEVVGINQSCLLNPCPASSY